MAWKGAAGAAIPVSAADRAEPCSAHPDGCGKPEFVCGLPPAVSRPTPCGTKSECSQRQCMSRYPDPVKNAGPIVNIPIDRRNGIRLPAARQGFTSTPSAEESPAGAEVGFFNAALTKMPGV